MIYAKWWPCSTVVPLEELLTFALLCQQLPDRTPLIWLGDRRLENRCAVWRV
jgi:hypothetical protein